MSEEEDLEFLALLRLGLASRVDATPHEPGERLLDALGRRGTLQHHQVQAVRAYVARHRVSCACGANSLAPEAASAFACGACGALLVRSDPEAPFRATPAPPAPAPGVGARLGPLELLSVLGKGASGTVYEARHLKLGRLSAVKIVPAAALDDKKRKRFEREIASLARLDHPAIVKVHASFDVGDSLACEMDLIRGETLEARLARGPLPWREAVSIVARLARAVEHAHAHGVVHRDLKPANVLLRAEDGAPFIADYGLALLADQASSLTRTGAVLGTPLYMAPEALAGKAGPEVDVYGLGAILYEAVAGRPPFEAPNPLALYTKIARGLCPALAVPGTPEDLEPVRARAMAPEPRHRPSAKAFAASLERLVASEPQRPWPRGARSAVVAALGLAVLAVALELARALSRAAPREEPPPPALEDQPATPVERALRDLARGDARARGEASRTLLAAVAREGEPVLRALDVAIERTPSSLDLRRLRAEASRQRAAPLAVDDLVALAADPFERDALAKHAAFVGVTGEDGPVKLRALLAEHRESAALASAFGLAVCASGAAEMRGEAVSALASGRPARGRAQLVARALADVDRVCRALGPMPVSPSEWKTLTARAGDSARAVAADPSLAKALAVILAPLGETAREAWRQMRLGDLTFYEADKAFIEMLDGLQASLDGRLLAIVEILREPWRDVTKTSPASLEEIERAGESILCAEPLLGAIVVEIATARVASTLGAIDEASAERLRTRFDLAEHAVLAFSRDTVSPSSTERMWAGVVRHDCQAGRSNLEERLAERDPLARSGHFERALELRLKALEISRGGGLLPGKRDGDARIAVRLVFLLDRLDEAERLLPDVPERDAIRAELLRRRGALAEALALAERTAAQELKAAGLRPDAVGVLAIIEADLGRFESARRHLDVLRAAERQGQAVLECLRTSAVEAYLARKKSASESAPR